MSPRHARRATPTVDAADGLRRRCREQITIQQLAEQTDATRLGLDRAQRTLPMSAERPATRAGRAILICVSERERTARQAAPVTPFPELNDLLNRFARRVRSILADDLVGIYLTGSFALGGGDEASDCDFLVVTGDALRGAEERDIRELHAEIPTWPGYWATNLEGSYAPRSDLQSLAALGRPWLYVDRGSRELERSAHCNTADVRWVLAERPLIVHGLDPRKFACKVPAHVLQGRMRPRIESFLDDLATWASFELSWTQRYAVEASSRMLYTLEHGEVIAKQDALRWAAATLAPEWRGLLEQVRRDRLSPWNDPPRPGSVERSISFVEYVQSRAAGGGTS
jgi:aminoglycoside adenylyltransferase-like protein/nucleotidyltransferase-like protein